MAKQLVVKLEYQDELRKIAATSIKEEAGRLMAFNGNDKVAEFPLGKIDHWSFEEAA